MPWLGGSFGWGVLPIIKGLQVWTDRGSNLQPRCVPSLGVYRRQPITISLSPLSLSFSPLNPPPLSLKINNLLKKHILQWGLKGKYLV